MRTANPTLSSKTFEGLPQVLERTDAMTVQGTVNKTAMLLLLVVATAAWT